MLTNPDRAHRLSKTILDHLGLHSLRGKRVIDFGAGDGEILVALVRHGATGVAVDARQENLDAIRRKYPFIQTIRLDLDSDEWPFDNQSFDIALSLGTLSHLRSYDRHLTRLLGVAEQIVLETEVLDSRDVSLRVPIYEERTVNYLSYSGEGSIVSGQQLTNRISDMCATYRAVTDTRLNHGQFRYDWVERGAGRVYGTRRLWFIKRDPFWRAKNPLPVSEPSLTITDPIAAVEPLAAADPPPSLVATAVQVIQPSAGPSALIHGKSPRIAVCVAGHLRTFDRTAKSFLRSIIGQYGEHTDFFIHTWETLEGFCKCETCRGEREHLVRTDTRASTPLIQSIFHPKELVIDSYGVKDVIAQYATTARLQKPDLTNFMNHSIIEYLTMLYSWKQAGQLVSDYEKRHGFQYDIIVRLRPDILFDTPLDVGKLTVPSMLLLPSIATYYSGGCNDQFAAGNATAMKHYLSFYDHVCGYLANRAVAEPSPERLLAHHLRVGRITINTTSMRYYILRSNGRFLYPRGTGMLESTAQSQIQHLI